MTHPPPPRGRQPQTRLPKEENERIIEETLRRVRAMTFPLTSVAGGGSTSTGFATYTPLVIAAGETFTVPTNTQMLYAIPIQVEGSLIIEGELVEVD